MPGIIMGTDIRVPPLNRGFAGCFITAKHKLIEESQPGRYYFLWYLF